MQDDRDGLVWQRLRKSGGFTQEELSKLSRVRRNRIADAEQDRISFTRDESERVAAALFPAIKKNFEELMALLTKEKVSN